jgi:DNA-binding NtrC family response regulator
MEVTRRLPTIAGGDATVLIGGETGTGKELAARAIHYLGPRAAFPFVPVNCGALPDTLLEAELFGHERGAFTDARGARAGLVHEAQGGTLCLDEVDSLTPRAQVVLLRLLQDRTFRPIGSSRLQRGDVRFVAITNARLADRIAAGAFRADLYYRLSVFTLELPPLRERKGDVPMLAEHFLQLYAHGPAVPRLSPGAAAALLAHDWPGNVRELENAILRAVQSCSDGMVQVEDLGLPLPDAGPEGAAGSFTVLKRRAIEAFEREYLLTLMRRSAGNVTRAARAAGKDRRDLGRLLRKYRLDPRAFAGVPTPHLRGEVRPAS